MKKVLLITYYWPPSGGSGVQRWLNFTKYLPDFGIESTVYTISNPHYAIEDFSLQTPKGIKIIRQSIWEPYRMASAFSGKNMKETSSGFLDQSKSVKTKIINYIRANYFIPDARKFWVKPSVKFLKKHLLENNIDTIITSGPPHSLHLIGLQLQESLNIKWIADFRDPWTQIDYFQNLPFTKRALQKHFDLERVVAQKADVVLVVGKTMGDYYAAFNKRVYVISNGFETVENQSEIALTKEFSLTHIGLLNADRNSDLFWEVIRELIDENAEFKAAVLVQLIGKVADEVKLSIEKYQLNEVVTFINYLPHIEVLNYQKASQVLLVLVNRVPSAKGIITGKIFEYLLANRPILAIGPLDGDLAEVLNKTNAGKIVDFDDKSELKKNLMVYFEAYKNHTLVSKSQNIDDYNAKTIVGKLAEIINTN